MAMTAGTKNRVAWRLASFLSAVLLVGSWQLFLLLRPYWMAKHQGQKARLQDAILAAAPLAGVARFIVTYDPQTRWPGGFDPEKRMRTPVLAQ
jgi:hypothetical protein